MSSPTRDRKPGFVAVAKSPSPLISADMLSNPSQIPRLSLPTPLSFPKETVKEVEVLQSSINAAFIAQIVVAVIAVIGVDLFAEVCSRDDTGFRIAGVCVGTTP